MTNNSLVSTCSIFTFLGGIGIFGQGSKLTKEYSNLTHHFRIRISFFFIPIDQWTNNNLLVLIDSITIFMMSFNDSNVGNYLICDDNEYNDTISPIDFVFLHNNSNMNVEIITGLDSNLGSWGIFNLSISLHLCDQSCVLCSSFGQYECLSCPIGYYLKTDNSCQICNITTCPMHCNNTQVIFDYTCIDNCSEHYFVGKNRTCLECDDSCKTCNDESNKNCLSCPNITFLFEGTCAEECPEQTYKNLEERTCSPCHYTCNSCVGPFLNECTSCENKTRTFTNISFNSLFLCNTGTCACNTGFYDDGVSLYCFSKSKIL